MIKYVSVEKLAPLFVHHKSHIVYHKNKADHQNKTTNGVSLTDSAIVIYLNPI
jgi:hypothetical protein